MKLILKEDPREWQKFVSVLMVIPVIVSALLWRRGVLGAEAFYAVLGGAGLVAGLAWIWARPFRRVYRVGMRGSFYVGQAMGVVLLTVVFFGLVTPMGWLLRLAGKDLLRLKRPEASSYWHPSKSTTHFDRQF